MQPFTGSGEVSMSVKTSTYTQPQHRKTPPCLSVVDMTIDIAYHSLIKAFHYICSRLIIFLCHYNIIGGEFWITMSPRIKLTAFLYHFLHCVRTQNENLVPTCTYWLSSGTGMMVVHGVFPSILFGIWKPNNNIVITGGKDTCVKAGIAR